MWKTLLCKHARVLLPVRAECDLLGTTRIERKVNMRNVSEDLCVSESLNHVYGSRFHIKEMRSYAKKKKQQQKTVPLVRSRSVAPMLSMLSDNR